MLYAIPTRLTGMTTNFDTVLLKIPYNFRLFLSFHSIQRQLYIYSKNPRHKNTFRSLSRKGYQLLISIGAGYSLSYYVKLY